MNLRRATFVAVLALAGVELLAAARAYRSIIGAEAWRRAARIAADLPPDEPVLLAEGWLGERARQAVPATRAWASVAPPDLWGPARIHVLGLQSWSEELTRALEGRAPPRLVEQTSLGALTWSTYAFAAPARVTFDLVADGPGRVTIDGARCRGHAGAWRCRRGQVAARTVEVDFRARRCLELAVVDGARVTLGATVEAKQAGRLRGHVGFGDFNARLRGDGPARVELAVDGVARGRFLATDAQGWLPFTAPLAPGRHEVELQVTVPAAGTWQREGYGQRVRHVPCVELRLLEGAEGGGR